MYFLSSSLTLLVCNLYFNLYSLLNSVADHLTDLYSTGNYLLFVFQKVQMSPSETLELVLILGQRGGTRFPLKYQAVLSSYVHAPNPRK